MVEEFVQAGIPRHDQVEVADHVDGGDCPDGAGNMGKVNLSQSLDGIHVVHRERNGRVLSFGFESFSGLDLYCAITTVVEGEAT